MTIEWNEKFSVSNTAIDAEHKSLFDALNSFYQGVQSGASNESLAALLTKLADYAATHFRSEEIFMKRLVSRTRQTQAGAPGLRRKDWGF